MARGGTLLASGIGRRAAGRITPAGVVFGLLAALAAAPVAAQSLKSMRQQEAAEAALADEAAYTNSVCGGSIAVSIDWTSADQWTDGDALVAACGGALGAIEALCRAPDGQTRAGAIDSFVCAGDGLGASLSGGELRYGASPGDNGFAETSALLADLF